MQGSASSRPVQPRSGAWFDASVSEFLALEPTAVLGKLAAASSFDVRTDQRNAWLDQVAILGESLRGLDGRLYLEFDVPRLGSRVDAVLVSGAAVFPIEFKIGQTRHEKADYDQAWDYALDLKNFHAASHDATILPVLVATRARHCDDSWLPLHSDRVSPPRKTNAGDLGRCLRTGVDLAKGPLLDADGWGRSAYLPTPTIIEAARALYANHSVEAISRNDAGARNLTVTATRVESAIEAARRESHKAIIFVTGVPGAGKTLVGLNAATNRRDTRRDDHAVFLSGNGPLVDVLSEALVRDAVERERQQGRRLFKQAAGQRVKAFIQKVHHFRDEGVRDLTRPPADHVAIFDEAQRVWDLAMTSSFMRQKKGHREFAQSEAQFLIGYMDRHRDWAAIVCLVGGGQEINRGEVGIRAWLDAIREHFPHWKVHVSPHLRDSEYDAADAVASLSNVTSVVPDADLHLATSMRSFRAENVSRFVRAALDGEMELARELIGSFSHGYPIVLTRDLERARSWLRENARGTERIGLVASSQGQRLRPHAIDVRVEVNPVHWFLNPPDDVRSSSFLEDAATEFKVQGLELDWSCVTWDADLRRGPTGWTHHSFQGDRWTNVAKPQRRRNLLNAYRVLLTRARQGMVIFVPPGALPGTQPDATRAPGFYEATAQYLRQLGIPSID
jgi:hypothetical protein